MAVDGARTVGVLPCPRCGTGELVAGRSEGDEMVSCACGHRAYAGYVAELAALQARARWLDERIAAGDPAPDRATRRAHGIWPAPGPAPATEAGRPAPAAARAAPGAGGPAPGAGRPAGLGAQTVLLALGAGLLVVAGTVFTAVMWERLGAVGQVSIMAGATLGVGALAAALRSRLRGTAEALAVVASGLAVVDAVAAPLLGLLPRDWLQGPGLYPAVVLAGFAVLGVSLSRRLGLRAWAWLGWLAVPVSAAAVVAFVAGRTDGDPARVAAAVSLPALTCVALLAGPTLVRGLARDRVPMGVTGAIGLVISAQFVAASALRRDALPGATVTAVLTTVAVGLLATRTRLPWWRLGAALLSGVSVALLLLLPADPQPAWLGVVAALAGLGLAGILDRLGERSSAGWAAAVVWAAWAIGRLSAGGPAEAVVQDQLALLAAVVAAICFAGALSAPAVGWAGAVLAELALALSPVELPDQVEAASLPFAALLLAAGLLWRRGRRGGSVIWLGPAATVALIPSAMATWAAPWVLGDPAADRGEHLLRLALVLAVAVLAAVAGARGHLAGLLVPAAVALALAGGAQVWTGLDTLPRWVSLGLAGTALVVAGARLEWLRGQGQRVQTWVRELEPGS